MFLYECTFLKRFSLSKLHLRKKHNLFLELSEPFCFVFCQEFNHKSSSTSLVLLLQPHEIITFAPHHKPNQPFRPALAFPFLSDVQFLVLCVAKLASSVV